MRACLSPYMFVCVSACLFISFSACLCICLHVFLSGLGIVLDGSTRSLCELVPNESIPITDNGSSYDERLSAT